ncbi:hypothetical protein BX616_004578 [Lobosporangium transversale]|uniref:F-box domain-containing protein n=1 Tax=Lobosporangium transversale TaxID=64571 RepID=A0A1Y2GWT2_9FUNG|nr:hypothetical protein BCR41DRAFT_393369 [Lobosporangium transversale]KAF9916113.1 hypothetical protein BX616_004578 [Lobosporangium transversale]ORZ26758.1 hypothetical protein BCR41DRAFT_393369 [Lobosporangium transversale]|eukprot:XP_021884521.1 hypothetical protein BCR41DRAFT_393369 [Lobosporangium transversale]
MDVAIFDIPHIIDSIGQCLNQSDLFSCILVSRQWHSAFIPILWAEPEYTQKKSVQILPTALWRYRHHIRSIKQPWIARLFLEPLPIIATVPRTRLGTEENEQAEVEWSFPNIQSFCFHDNAYSFGFRNSLKPDTIDGQMRLARMASSFTSLKTFNIHLDGWGNRVLIALMASVNILRSYNNLREVSLSVLDPEEYRSELIACCFHLPLLNAFGLEIKRTIGLTPVTLAEFHDQLQRSIEKISPVSATSTTLTPTAPKPIATTKIQNFKLAISGFLEKGSILPLFIERCPSLKSISISDSGSADGSLGTEFIRMVKDGRVPSLEHAYFRSANEDIHYPELSFIDLIQSTGAVSNGGGKGLKTLAVNRGFDGFSDQCLMDLQQYHSKTMTRLEVGDYMQTSLFSTLLDSLPELKTLKLSLTYGYEPKLPLSQSLVARGPKNLTTLVLKSRFDPEHKTEYKHLNYIYAQVSLLDQLQKLQVYTDRRNQLSLRYNNLKQLKTLKSLKKFSCFHLHNLNIDPRREYPIHRFSRADAEWMDENWPALNEVNLGHDLCQIEFSTRLNELRPAERTRHLFSDYDKFDF